MEDLILVTGCTLVTSWGIGAFLDNTQDAAVSLRSQASDGGGATFDWREIHPSVACQNSDQDPVRPLRPIPASFADSSCATLKRELYARINACSSRAFDQSAYIHRSALRPQQNSPPTIPVRGELMRRIRRGFQM